MTSSRSARALSATALAALVVACGSPEATPPAEPRAVSVDEDLRALLPEDLREAGVLTVATDPSYPPASSFGPDGRTIVGFEPDLTTALGDVLGLEVEFRQWDFDSMLADLAADEFDLLVSSMTDTLERQAVADFVNYFQAGTSVVVQRGNPYGIHDLTDLCGRVVAIEGGTVQVDLVARSQSRCGDRPVQLNTFPTNDDALLELRTGRAAAVLNDYPPAVFVTTSEQTGGAFQLMSDVQYEPGLYGIGVGKDDPELRDALAGALQVLVESGVYEQILAKWAVGSGAVTEVTVNGLTPGTP